jgi:hypothetical protein
METIQLKLEFENSLRRASFSSGQTLEQLRATISSLIDIKDFSIKYRDEENDLITIGSTSELQELVNSVGKTGKTLRLIVSKLEATESVQQNEPEAKRREESKPEIPWANLARSLADPQVVSRIQAAFTSEILTESVNRVASTYLESKGDFEAAANVATEQLPLIFALLAEVTEDIPVLREVQSGFPLFAMFPFFGNFFGVPQAAEAARCAVNEVHPGVFCDGCGFDPELKRTSSLAGHINQRGWIRGLRHKSETVHDFDLCESCRASGKFPDDSYGPFQTMKGEARGRCGRFRHHRERRGHHHCHPHGPPEHHHPEHHHGHPEHHHGHPEHHHGHPEHHHGHPEHHHGHPEHHHCPSHGEQHGNFWQQFSRKAQEAGQDLPQKAVVAEKVEEDDSPDWVPVPLVEDPFVKWNTALAELQTLGFVNSETYISLLEEEKGDLERVVNRIIRRDL